MILNCPSVLSRDEGHGAFKDFPVRPAGGFGIFFDLSKKYKENSVQILMNIIAY
jgi:hypothetical protein